MRGEYVKLVEDLIKGGKADKKTIEDIADKHQVPVSDLKKELEMGIKVEREHTDSDEMAREIAMDHLAEKGQADYYTKLAKMEKE